MASTGGLIHGCGGSKRSSTIEAAIASDDRFTDTVVSSDVSITRPELVFVSLQGDKIDYVGIVQPGRKVATGQKTVSISHLQPLGIDIEKLLANMDERFSSRIHFNFSGIERLPPKTWDALREAVLALGGMTAQAITTTFQRIASLGRSRLRTGGDVELFEHDAVAVALETWGGTRERKRRLRATVAPLDEMAPFLSRLGEVDVREDPQINHDAETLPGMEVAKRYQTGIAVLENARERLTIINCNRQKLEETLGVDLVYYNHSFKSFVMVQYKRMKRDASDNASYRPSSDGSYAVEIERMTGINTELRGIKCKRRNKIDGFRLASAPFFFKICSDRVARATEEGMASGMYVPLRLWRSLLKSKTTEGPRGGRVVTWDNCTRRFNNSEFTSLLRHGWIGSTPTQSEKLDEIIEKALAGKRMVVYAATSASSGREDYLRDDNGRFASDDDPFASR
jgi:hypothetical protein